MRKLLLYALSFLPTPLPVGIASFDAWANRILELSGKFADEDSMKWALASMIMHLPSTSGYKPNRYFVQALRKSAANQVATQVFHDLKQKQAEAAALANQSVEATTTENVASDGEKAS